MHFASLLTITKFLRGEYSVISVKDTKLLADITEAEGILRFYLNRLPENLWEVPSRICPGLVDKINIKWAVSLSLPGMDHTNGRVGAYRRNHHGYEVRIAVGVSRNIAFMHDSILIRGIWWYITKIMVYEIIGLKYAKRDESNFLRAAHICLYQTMCAEGKVSEDNVREHLTRRGFFLAKKLFDLIEHCPPEDWLLATENWVNNLITARDKRKVNSSKENKARLL